MSDHFVRMQTRVVLLYKTGQALQVLTGGMAVLNNLYINLESFFRILKMMPGLQWLC